VRNDLVRAVAWCAAFVLALLVFATVSRVTYGGGPDVDRLGVAAVDTCERHGPVGLYGLGTAYRCTADVRWSDGVSERLVFAPGQLAPGERDVPVYRDSQRRGADYLGRNDSAWTSAIRLPAVLAAGFLAVVCGIGAVYTTYRAFRGRPARPGPEHTRVAQQRKAARRTEREWPITAADRAAAPTPKIVTRFRLLSVWCALVVVLVPLSAVPRFDAPRAVHFVSRWPQIERAMLLDIPTAAVIFGLILGVLFFAMAGSARDDAARVVRYGNPYLARMLPGKGSPESKVRRALDARERRHRPVAGGTGVVLLALTIWAAVRAFGVASGPVAVWLACLTDVVLLGLLLVIWFVTLESPKRRFARLLGTNFRTEGTKTGVSPS
jgi:hypothetical protein